MSVLTWGVEGVGFWEFGLGGGKGKFMRRSFGGHHGAFCFGIPFLHTGLLQSSLADDGSPAGMDGSRGSRRGLGDSLVCQHLHNACKRMGTGVVYHNHESRQIFSQSWCVVDLVSLFYQPPTGLILTAEQAETCRRVDVANHKQFIPLRYTSTFKLYPHHHSQTRG